MSTRAWKPTLRRLLACWIGVCLIVLAGGRLRGQEPGSKVAAETDRSPVDLVLTPDEAWLITVNQTADSVSLVHVPTGRVAAEVPCGKRPAGLAITRDGRRLVVTSAFSGDLTVLKLAGETLKPLGTVHLGFEPRGVAISPDGKLAYVALASGGAVAVVDLDKPAELAQIDVGRWPRYLALSPDGTRLAVGCSGDGGVSVVDTAARKLLFQERFVGLNMGHMCASSDGRYVYFPWMAYGDNPITQDNIRRGWITASRIGRVRLDEKKRREAIALDVRGQAVADPLGIALSPDEKWLALTAGGSHELLVYRTEGLPFIDYGGPGDHIDPELSEDSKRFFRIPLDGRPMGVRMARDGRHVFVANYLLNAVQVVDLQERRVARTIPLGGPSEPSLARRGEAIFYDGRRSLDQWYSCHTCHYEGGTNSVAMDTNNDGTPFSFKTVLSLYNVDRTGPWTWHGWQTDLRAALTKSLTDTMQGPQPSDADLDALAAFLKTLQPPPNPNRGADGSLSEQAARGRELFQSARAGCAECHSGPLLTDGLTHDVGLGQKHDRYKGFNTPSLIGLFNRVRLLHDGREKTIEAVLSGPHSPTKVTGGEDFTAAELADLAAYLRTL